MESSKAALDMAKSDLELYRKLGESSVTRQKIQQAETTVQQDEATYNQAVISRDTAQLNLDRPVVRAPVNGVLTNFSMRPGNYVTAGSAVTALIDSDSYHISGYFEENKLDRIKVGDEALVYLMGSKTPLKGHVDGVAGASKIASAAIPAPNLPMSTRRLPGCGWRSACPSASRLDELA